MPRYVMLWNWTDAGIKDVRETTARVETVRREFEKRGAALEVHWTVGPYDGIGMMEAPDDESATAALLWLGSADGGPCLLAGVSRRHAAARGSSI